MAEYVAVDYDGFYNSNKQNTEILDAPIISNSFINNLRFNTLESDINKSTNPLNFVTEWSNTGSDIYKFYGKNSLLTSNPSLLTTINTDGNLYTIGTLTSGSDDRIKSHEINIENATETLLKLTPKIYDKHPSVRFHEDQEENDLTNIPHFKESGLIAQEVLKDAFELEHLVVKPKTENDLYGMNYIGLIPYLIKSNQELYALLEIEKQKLEELTI
jgi:hypothetical protein